MGHAVMTTNRHNMLGTVACSAYCLILLHTWPTVFTAMAASSDDAETSDMVTVYGFKGCPLGDAKCPKAKQWLGGSKTSFYSERRCRQAVFDHLMCSPWHNGMMSSEARSHAWTVDLESHEVANSYSKDELCALHDAEEKLVYFDDETEDTVNDKVAQPKGSQGRGKGGKDVPTGKGSGGGKDLATTRKRWSNDPPEPADPPGVNRQVARISSDLERNIRQQTQNAYVFVQAMSRAEAALRTAAKVSEAAHRTFMDIIILTLKICGPIIPRDFLEFFGPIISRDLYPDNYLRFPWSLVAKFSEICGHGFPEISNVVFFPAIS